MRVGVKSDIGRMRRANEDAYWVSPPWYAVADGMGGHVAGEVASRLAVNAVESVALEEEGTPPELIRRAVQRANSAVWQQSQLKASLTGMGTTLTVARIDAGQCMIGHVGDSRCYIWREATIRQLTHDHSIVAELVRTGSLTESEAIGHPQRNLLTRALGMGPHIEPDIIEETVFPGDKILLCTDGLTSVVPVTELARLLGNDTTPDNLARRLVSMANDRGGPDNITVLLIEIAAP